MIYSSVKRHDLCYAVSESPVKGFRYGGIIVSIGDIGIVEEEQAVNYLSNTHGGLVEIEGQWYVFYHRHTNRHRNSRQMCGEPIKIAEDGRITKTEVTSCGLNGGLLQGTGRYEARVACNLSSARGTFMYQKEKRQEKRCILILHRMEKTERIIPINILLICGMAHEPDLNTSISDRAAGLESVCGEMQKVKCWYRMKRMGKSGRLFRYTHRRTGRRNLRSSI